MRAKLYEMMFCKIRCNETLTFFFSGVGVGTGGVAAAADFEMSYILRVIADNCANSLGRGRHAVGVPAIVSKRRRAWLSLDTASLSSASASISVQKDN
jgi:hypothetical protein